MPHPRPGAAPEASMRVSDFLAMTPWTLRDLRAASRPCWSWSRVLLVFAEAPGSRPLAMRLEREQLLALFHDHQARVDYRSMVTTEPEDRNGSSDRQRVVWAHATEELICYSFQESILLQSGLRPQEPAGARPESGGAG